MRGRAVARTASRIAERSAGDLNGPATPFQWCRVAQLDSRRRTVAGAMRAVCAQQPLGAQTRGDLRRHAVARIGVPAGRIPQMMRDEFQSASASGAGQGRGIPVAASTQASR